MMDKTELALFAKRQRMSVLGGGHFEWYFSAEEIEKAKIKTEKKNKTLNYNNLEKKSDHRHVGFLAEKAFYIMLKVMGWDKPARWFYDDLKKDDLDFKIGKLNIDVKCWTWTTQKDWKWYPCSILNQQYKKIFINQWRPSPINAFVFSSFIEEEGKIVILGWVTKDEFNRKADFRPKGTPLGKSGLTLSTDDYIFMYASWDSKTRAVVKNLNPLHSIIVESGLIKPKKIENPQIDGDHVQLNHETQEENTKTLN